MADDIQRTIYKLELDDSAYVKGIESLSASTKKFSQSQTEANERLKTNEAALKSSSDFLEKSRKSLENYTGTNAKYRQQLERDVQKAEAEQKRLTDIVDQNRLAYEKATKAAQDFANTSAKASTLPQQASRTTPAPIVQSPILDQINQSQIGELQDIAQNSANEFQQLAAAVTLAEDAMKGLNEESDEFKALAPIVEQGKVVLKQYEDAAQGAGEKTTSLRGQLRQAREELVRLEQAGKAGTKQYIDLEIKTAKLTDAFGDQQERIKVLASDTRALDFGKAAITSATAAFSAYTSVSVLAGGASEELQKKTLQLFAAMQLVTSLEQVANQVKRGGVLATNAQSAAQAAYTAVVGSSTGALKVFKLALAATGIGAAIIAIGFLVEKYNELAEAERKANINQVALLEINKKAVDSYADEVTHLKLLSAEYQNSATSLGRKKEIQDELQKSYPSYFKDLDTQADKEAYIALQVGKVTEALILQAKVQAAQSLLSEKFADLLKKQFDPTEAVSTFEVISSTIRNTFGSLGDVGQDLANKAKENTDAAQKEYNDFEKFIIGFVTDSNKQLQLLGGDPKKTPAKTSTKAAEDEFAKQKAALDKRLQALRTQEAEGEIEIVKEFAKKRELEKAEIDKAKNLTKPQKNILKAELDEINGVELSKALETFRKKVKDAREKLNDELIKLQQQNNQDTINLIQDEFEKRAALIDLNEKQDIDNAKQANQDRLAALEFDKLLLGEQVYQDAKAKIVSEGEIEVNNIIAGANADRQDLSADIFARSLETLENVLDESLLQLDETTSDKIQEQKALLASGAINYDEFQKSLTKILADQKKERDKLRLEELNTELTQINKRLETVTDAEEKAELKKKQRSVRKSIADINADVPKDEKPVKEIETLQDYVSAVGQLTDSVISFWQKANEAESKALDRSISLQEKRVEAAQRIAERGNATYLKQEQDRLNELQVRRENAARRELAINAALQASQLLVGITGAISKIATPGIGIAETIGAIGTIFAALATGYGLVKSLQGNQPRLKKGTKYLTRDGNPSGVDTIPVMANEGEAVIPTEINKKYHPTIAAIYDQKIPADQLNNFVNTYHKIKSVPQPNYERIKEAAEIKISQDGRMAVAISEQNKLILENNDLQRQTLRAMKNMSVSANIDRDGVAIMVNEFIQQMNIDKKI